MDRILNPNTTAADTGCILGNSQAVKDQFISHIRYTVDVKTAPVVVRMIPCDGNTAAPGDGRTVILLDVQTASIQCSLIPGNGAIFIGKIACAIDPYTAAADTGAVVVDLTAIHR